MLLFIVETFIKAFQDADFNTSHVTVYLEYLAKGRFRNLHFNTSHVTVYRITNEFPKQWIVISIHLMLLFIVSHYHNRPMPFSFQYISCYCLSLCPYSYCIRIGISIHLMLLFIWIRTGLQQYLPDFNTSHVTVYRYDT